MAREKESQYASIDTRKSKIERPNTYIIYATAANQEAQDGDKEDHGVFTKLLLKYMDSDDSIDTVFNKIQKDLGHSNVEQVCILKSPARMF